MADNDLQKEIDKILAETKKRGEQLLAEFEEGLAVLNDKLNDDRRLKNSG